MPRGLWFFLNVIAIAILVSLLPINISNGNYVWALLDLVGILFGAVYIIWGGRPV